jgi:hypothetical protein
MRINCAGEGLQIVKRRWRILRFAALLAGRTDRKMAER